METRFRLKHQQLAAELAKSRMSQNRWADKLGLGRGHLSLLVNGKRPYPSAETRQKLVEGLGVPFSTLFEVEERPMPGSDRPRHTAWIPRDPGPLRNFAQEAIVPSLYQDLRHAVRGLLARPLFSIVVILVLALGIGANTAMFSWLHSLLLDPLTVAEPDRWVSLGVRQASGFVGSFSYPNFDDHRERNEVFDDLIAFRTSPVAVSQDGESRRATAGLVSGNYFTMLGGRAAGGRPFSDAEDQVPGRDAVVVLGHGFWQRAFGGDPDIVGDTLTINARPFTVIGVMEPGFRVSRVEVETDLWIPLAMEAVVRPGGGGLDCRGCGFLNVMARLGPEGDMATAAERINAVHDRLVAEYPDQLEGTAVSVRPAAETYLGGGGTYQAMTGLFAVLMAVVGAVLLICCANVAALLLARAADREREIGIRQALGASRRRLLRLLLGESLLVAAAGGGLGVALAFALNRLLLAAAPPFPIPIRFGIDIDGRVLAFTAALTLLTAFLFGLVPALKASRFRLVEQLKGSDVRVVGSDRTRMFLVTGQIALSLVLLVGAGMFLRSLTHASRIDPGFEDGNLLVATVDPGLQGYSRAEVVEFYRRLVRRTEALPGTASASLAEMIPLTLGGTQQWGATVEGYEPAPDERMSLDYNYVGPGYFETMGMELLEGREFTWDDTADTTGAIIVNETMAERFWPGTSPLGQRVHSGGMWREVVGVIEDARYYSLGEDPLSYMYFPFTQSDQSALALHVRTTGPPLDSVAPVRRLVQELDPTLPVFDVGTMTERIGGALLPARMAAGILGAFGVLALLLASVGLYGVIAYAVGRRTREIGIRMALGAGQGDIRRMVLRQAGVMTAVGIALGILGGLVLARVASGLLYGVGAMDPIAWTGAVAVIATVSIAASLLPTRKAIRIDPVTALRAD